MKITLSLVFETVHALALALWLGGEAAFIVLVSCGINMASHKFIVREQSLIEFAAIVMIGVQFLTRHRYKSIKTLFLANAVRNLLTFAALILAVYVMNSVKDTVKYKSIGVLESETMAYITAGAQIALLTIVSSVTLWLLAASARLAASAPVTAPIPAATIEKQTPIPSRPVRKRGPKR